jgi:hypothetical protein
VRASSAKAKGRRLATRLAERLLETFRPHLSDLDIRVVPSGVPGEDLWLSPAACARIPYTFECKNVERINVWDAIKQSQQHGAKTGREPVVVFSKNHSEDYVVLRLDHYLELINGKT